MEHPTGQVADLRDRGIPIARPCPSWSVFDRRTRSVSPAWGDGDVVEVERDELGAAHRGAKADQQERPVAAASRGIDPQLAHDAPQILGQQRALRNLACAVGPADAGQPSAIAGCLPSRPCPPRRCIAVIAARRRLRVETLRIPDRSER